MLAFFKKFTSREDGAVTVDWVVLTAAVAGLSIFVISTLRSDSNNLSALTAQYLSDQDPAAAAGGNIQD
jgi:Flp pilus assembly pilin Flp